MYKTLVLSCFVLSGCASTAPFVEYEHLSLFNIDDEGYDLACGGIIAGESLTISGSVCENVRGGTHGKVNVRYIWK
jgi:hypothetical protein